jgi:hypothetical protein
VGRAGNTGPFTVFAPTDSAFNDLRGKNGMENLLKVENKDRLLSILRYHIVPGRVTADQLQKMNILKTVETQELSVRRAKGQVTVNGANVRQPGLPTTNGVVYVVDKVLLPRDDEGKWATVAAQALTGKRGEKSRSHYPLWVRRLCPDVGSFYVFLSQVSIFSQYLTTI